MLVVGTKDGKSVTSKNAIAAVTVSTTIADAENLLDDTEFNWQSNGSSGTHWILVEVHPHVVYQTVALRTTDKSSSFNPETVTVWAGSSKDDLKLIKKVTCVPSIGKFFPLICSKPQVIIILEYVYTGVRGCEYTVYAGANIRGTRVCISVTNVSIITSSSLLVSVF